jgi:hypothetical protein
MKTPLVAAMGPFDPKLSHPGQSDSNITNSGAIDAAIQTDEELAGNRSPLVINHFHFHHIASPAANSATAARLLPVNLDASLASSIKTQVSGRFLLFIGPSTPDGKPSESVDMQMLAMTSVYIPGKEVPALVPGACVDIDADDTVFSAPLSHAPSGKYQVQAVLDVHHSYHYDGRSAGDIVSVPATITIPYTGASEHLGNPSNRASCESLFSAG